MTETARREKADAFDAILRDLASAHQLPLIEGRALLADAGGLSTDLLHPADHGMFQMGENLADALRPHVADQLAAKC